MAAWGVPELLLRQIDLRLAGANWQRGGGKGQKPKPVPLPDSTTRSSKPPPARSVPADVGERLRNLGLIPPGSSD